MNTKTEGVLHNPAASVDLGTYLWSIGANYLDVWNEKYLEPWCKIHVDPVTAMVGWTKISNEYLCDQLDQAYEAGSDLRSMI